MEGAHISPEEYARRHAAVSATKWDTPYGGNHPIVEEAYDGDHFLDADGNMKRDVNGGILCTIFNPQDPEIRNAIIDQAKTGVLHTSSVAGNLQGLLLKEELAETTSQYGLKKALPGSSGSVIDSMAYRAMRPSVARHKGDQNVRHVALESGYSGATGDRNSECGLGVWQGKSTPPNDFVRLIHPTFEDIPPFDPSLQVAPEDIEPWFQTNIDSSSPSEKIIPISVAELMELGVGGFRRPTKAWRLAFVRAIRKRGGKWGLDGVQSFPGRTGDALWGFEDWVEKEEDFPDVVTTAKALGNGLPIAAMMMTDEIADNLDGKWFDTGAFNPLISRVARVVLRKSRSPEIRANVKERGAQQKEGLEGIQRDHAKLVRAVVGQGLMMGIAVVPEKLEAVRAAAYDEGLHVGLGADGTVRLAPHFDTNASGIEEGVQMLRRAIAKIEATM